jgi:urease accessory protein
MQPNKDSDEDTSAVFGMLNLLQFADSQFPSGSFAFSGGLEALFNDQKISTPEQVYDFIAAQLTHRWNSLDRVALCRSFNLCRSFKQTSQVDDLVSIDKEVDALTLSEGLRNGSCRNGAALLSIHSRLGTAYCKEYRQLILCGEAPGHIAVIQGLVWSQNSFSELQAQAASAHGVCTDLLGAAMRLGKLGHLHAQLIRQNLSLLASELLSEPVSNQQLMHSYLPATEIAAMRHEVSDQRLFAN